MGGDMIINSKADPMLLAFFGVIGVALLVLSIMYFMSKDKVKKLFGIGILLNAIAFSLWAFMMLSSPESIEAITTIGTVVFIASFIVFSLVVASSLKGMTRFVTSAVTAIAFAVLILLRFVYVKSEPHFMENGLFNFGTDAEVMYAYVVISALTIMPAVYIIADKIKDANYRVMVQLGGSLAVISISVLLISADAELQTLNGYGMALGIVLAAFGQIKYDLSTAATKKITVGKKKTKK